MDMVYGGHSNSGLMAGLNDLKGFCHPKWLYGFVIPYFERRLMQSKKQVPVKYYRNIQHMQYPWLKTF